MPDNENPQHFKQKAAARHNPTLRSHDTFVGRRSKLQVKFSYSEIRTKSRVPCRKPRLPLTVSGM